MWNYLTIADRHQIPLTPLNSMQDMNVAQLRVWAVYTQILQERQDG